MLCVCLNALVIASLGDLVFVLVGEEIVLHRSGAFIGSISSWCCVITNIGII